MKSLQPPLRTRLWPRATRVLACVALALALPVAVTGGEPAQAAEKIANGGFENGLTGWTVTGAASVSGTAQGGASAAMVGRDGPSKGDSTVKQAFTVPTGGTLNFSYR